MLVIKHTVIKLKNAFDEFINKLDMIKEWISELKEMSIETTKYKKKWKRELVIQDLKNNYKCVTYM